MDSSRRTVLRSVVGAGGIAAAATIGSVESAAAATGSGAGWYDVTQAPYSATGSGNTDDTAAVQAALGAAAAAGGGVVYFPAGTYLISSALAGASGVRLAGPHRSVATIVSAHSPVLTMDGTFISGMEIDHLTLEAAIVDPVTGQATTGADLITGADLKALHVHDCQLIQNSAAHAIWNAPSAALMIECVFQRNIETVAGAARSIPAWSLSAPGEYGAFNANTWRDNVCTNSGLDATQYWFQMSATYQDGKSANDANTWDNITFEYPYGGMINLQSATRSRIQMCMAWDVPDTIENTLIALASYPGAGACSDTLIIGGPRAAWGSPMASVAYDISVDSNAIHTTIIHPTKGALIDLGGSQGADIIGAPTFMQVTSAATTASAGAGAGTSAPPPSVTAGPDNRSGLVMFGSGTSPTTGEQVKVTFGNKFVVTPTVMITPANGPTAGLLCAVESVSSTGFSLFAGNAPSAGEPGTHYGFYWFATD